MAIGDRVSAQLVAIELADELGGTSGDGLRHCSGWFWGVGIALSAGL